MARITFPFDGSGRRVCRAGQERQPAASVAWLHISEQGLRSRLLALEHRIGAELYHKAVGIRRRFAAD